MYNLDVGEHYYHPMTNYLEAERGTRGETPGALTFDERLSKNWLHGRRYEATEARERFVIVICDFFQRKVTKNTPLVQSTIFTQILVGLYCSTHSNKDLIFLVHQNFQLVLVNKYFIIFCNNL